MSKTIMIPDNMNPYYVEVNGVKYSYPAGTEQEVPDAVAEVIEANVLLEPKPHSGTGTFEDPFVLEHETQTVMVTFEARNPNLKRYFKIPTRYGGYFYATFGPEGESVGADYKLMAWGNRDNNHAMMNGEGEQFTRENGEALVMVELMPQDIATWAYPEVQVAIDLSFIKFGE